MQPVNKREQELPNFVRKRVVEMRRGAGGGVLSYFYFILNTYIKPAEVFIQSPHFGQLNCCACQLACKVIRGIKLLFVLLKSISWGGRIYAQVGFYFQMDSFAFLTF